MKEQAPLPQLGPSGLALAEGGEDGDQERGRVQLDQGGVGVQPQVDVGQAAGGQVGNQGGRAVDKKRSIPQKRKREMKVSIQKFCFSFLGGVRKN